MIYVIGGDGYDAQLGVKLLAGTGIPAQPLGISNSPSHYQQMLASGTSIDDFILEKLQAVQADVFLVFCNTLSFAIDWDGLSGATKTPILSLTTVYKEFIGQYSSLGVVACFEDTVHNIRKFCDKNEQSVKTLSYALVSLVEAVERKEPFVNDILGGLITTSASLNAEAFVMGCTHFEDYDLGHTPIDVIYPGRRLIEHALKNGYIPAQYRISAE